MVGINATTPNRHASEAREARTPTTWEPYEGL
jgi:hypothetical protein